MTVDVDFLLKRMPNTPEQLRKIVEEIIAAETGNDFITFELKDVAPIAVAKKYAGVGCCKRVDKRMRPEAFYRELVLALPAKSNSDGWDDTAYFASKVKKLNESEELRKLNLNFSAIIPYATSKAGAPEAKLEDRAMDTNFVDVVVQKQRLRISVNMKFSEIHDPKGMCKDITGLGRWGNGDVELFMEHTSDVDNVM